MPKTQRELFRGRLAGTRSTSSEPPLRPHAPCPQLNMRVVEGVHHFSGTATDEYDDNVTPLTASIGIKGAYMQGTHLSGHVRYSRGSLHNSPTTAIWLGTVGGQYGEDIYWGYGAVARRNANRRVVRWREKARRSRMVWVYEGEIDEDGRGIRGRFHLNIMPRKRGTFELRLRPAAVSDPTTLDDLCRRVLSEEIGRQEGSGPTDLPDIEP